jgi:hypothetical protein
MGAVDVSEAAMNRSTLRRVTLAAAVGALTVGLMSAPASAGAPTMPTRAAVVPTAVGPTALAATDEDVLVVRRGRIGDLRMGTTTKKARTRGWISRDAFCGGWTAGPQAILIRNEGEVFKAYPDKVSGGRVRSMHAMGDVVTPKGIRASGLTGSTPDPGSSLAKLRRTYRNLERVGSWTSDLTDERWRVFGVGNKRKGWMDFYIDPDTRRVGFIQVRAHWVKPARPVFGC